MTKLFEMTNRYLIMISFMLAGIALLWIPKVFSAGQANQAYHN